MARRSGRSSRYSRAKIEASRAPRILVSALGRLQMQHLPWIVPLVERGLRVEPLVALEADELGVQDAGEDLRDLGLAHPGVALDEERLAHLDREVEGGRHVRVGDVGLPLEGVHHRADRGFHRLLSDAATKRSASCRNFSRQPAQQK